MNNKIIYFIKKEIKIYLFYNYIYLFIGCFIIIIALNITNPILRNLSYIISIAFIIHLFYYLYSLQKRLTFDKLDLLTDVTAAKDDGAWLSNSANLNLYNIIRSLGDCSEFHFVDLGCGNGGTLYLAASHFKFKKITGVERDEKGYKVCRENLNNFKDVEIIYEDATQLKISSSMDFFYMSNPFGKETIKIVFDNIKLSYEQYPREIYLLYRSPRHHDVVSSEVYNFKLIKTFILKQLQGKRNWHYESMVGTEVNFYKCDKKAKK